MTQHGSNPKLRQRTDHLSSSSQALKSALNRRPLRKLHQRYRFLFGNPSIEQSQRFRRLGNFQGTPLNRRHPHHRQIFRLIQPNPAWGSLNAGSEGVQHGGLPNQQANSFWTKPNFRHFPPPLHLISRNQPPHGVFRTSQQKSNCSIDDTCQNRLALRLKCQSGQDPTMPTQGHQAPHNPRSYSGRSPLRLIKSQRPRRHLLISRQGQQ